MAFKIKTTMDNSHLTEYIQGYTSSAVGEPIIRINCKLVADEGMYDLYKRTNCLEQYEFKPNEPYGVGVELNKKQVRKLIWELIKWHIKGY